MTLTDILALSRASHTVPGGGIALVDRVVPVLGAEASRTFRVRVVAAAYPGLGIVVVETPVGPVSLEIARVTHRTADGRPLAWSPCSREDAALVLGQAVSS